MTGPRVLVAEDDRIIRDFLAETIRGLDMEVDSASGGAEAIRMLRAGVYDLVVTDLKMPGADGIEVLKAAKAVDHSTEVLLITAFGTVETVIEAMREGVADVLIKPFGAETIESAVEAAIERRSILIGASRRPGVGDAGGEDPFPTIIGVSRSIRETKAFVLKVAPTDATVLIEGESGTGKELFARAIHERSRRRERPFVPIHSAAIPETLLEAEIFGHEKGAFTGAVKSRKGLIEEAEGGTIFLDEIGDIGPSLQVKLLRFLQERRFRRVGENEERSVDVRIIAATNRNLAREMAEGRFREDLYYRLNIIPVRIEPLRMRREDIPVLVKRFAARFAGEFGRPEPRISPVVLEEYERYDWPGNVRELENVMRRAVALSEGGEIEKPFLDEASSAPERPRGGGSLDEVLDETQRRLILEALDLEDWVKARAAERLGIKRTTLIERMKRLGLDERCRDIDTKRGESSGS